MLRFNIMGIVFMMVAIWLGTFIGAGVASMIGFGGGILGAIIVGFIIYAVHALISGGKIRLVQGVIFAILVWLAQIIAGMIGGTTGLGGGLIGLFITALVLSFLWGWFGGRSAVTTPKKKRRRKHK